VKTLPQTLRAEAEVEAKEYSEKEQGYATEYHNKKAAFLSGYASCYSRLTKAHEPFDDFKVWKPSEIAKLVNEICTAFITLNDHKQALAQLRAENEALKEDLDRHKEFLRKSVNRSADLASALEKISRAVDFPGAGYLEADCGAIGLSDAYQEAQQALKEKA
jgi:predicted  nucleic acid-binding Zn-ribbon protein